METNKIVNDAVNYINANKAWNIIEEDIACEKMNDWRCGIAQVSQRISDGIQDLLEEYGNDNDLPEGWWMEYGDVDDWFFEI